MNRHFTFKKGQRLKFLQPHPGKSFRKNKDESGRYFLVKMRKSIYIIY